MRPHSSPLLHLPQLTLKTIEADTEGRKQAALVFYSLSIGRLVLFQDKCGQSSDAFILWQNEHLTFPLPNLYRSSLLGVITFLAHHQVQTGSYEKPTHYSTSLQLMFGSGSLATAHKKIISFTLGGALGCIFTQLLSSQLTGANRRPQRR